MALNALARELNQSYYFRVFQRNFDWYLDTPEGVYEFTDGLQIDYLTNKVVKSSLNNPTPVETY